MKMHKDILTAMALPRHAHGRVPEVLFLISSSFRH